MFAVRLQRIFGIGDKIIVRNLRGGRLSKIPNPGLENRIKSFEEEGFKLKNEDLETFTEQSESDFYKVGEVYNEHLNETMMGKYELRHQIVKEKYFKNNMPNLLTWSEKEQIRHLASTEPDEWTPEKIAESFPVTVPVVKRLLKYPWKPATEKRIARHDESVMRNWKELKEGSLDIPSDLQNHFLKFSNRTIPSLNKTSIKIEVQPEQNLGEFESIVRRCASREKSTSTDNENSLALSTSSVSNKSGEKLMKGKSDNKVVTLEELTHKIKKRLEKGAKVNINDKIIVDSVKPDNKVEYSHNVTKEIELSSDTTQPNSIMEYKSKDEDPKNVMNYPERIRIPKKAFKKGATYKVDDCFYDHDGKFLYRVLGMSN